MKLPSIKKNKYKRPDVRLSQFDNYFNRTIPIKLMTKETLKNTPMFQKENFKIY